MRQLVNNHVFDAPIRQQEKVCAKNEMLRLDVATAPAGSVRPVRNPGRNDTHQLRILLHKRGNDGVQPDSCLFALLFRLQWQLVVKGIPVVNFVHSILPCLLNPLLILVHKLLDHTLRTTYRSGHVYLPRFRDANR